MDEPHAHTPLRGELDTLNWSPEQLIARVNQHRARRGSAPLHPKSAYPWVRGSRPSTDPMADVLAVLSEHTGRTFTPAELGWDGPRTSRPRRFLDTPYEAPADTLLREIQGDPMERRSFVLLSGAAVTAPALDLLMGAPGPLRAAADGDRVSPHLAESIDRSVRQVRDLDDAEGSTSALLWAGGLWQNLAKVLTNSRYGTAEGRRLHTSYIEMSETYGWMLYDSGRHPAAQRVYQSGLRLAREVDGHANLHRATANLLASAAYQASWLGQHHEAATMLYVARTRKPGVLTPRLRAVLADREIVAAALRGDSEHVRAAVDQAHENLDAASDEEPWWSLWLGHEGVDSSTGRAWLALNRPDQAEPYLARRMSLVSDGYPRDRMLAAADLGTARYQGGDLEGAADAAGQALDLAQHVASHRVHDRLDNLIEHLRKTHGQDPRVRSLIERRDIAV